MTGLLTLSRWIDRGNALVGSLVIWAILASTLISAINAIVRKAFNYSSNGWLEAQWYLFGAAFMLAAADTLRRNEHVRIDVVYGLLPRRRQNRIDLFGHLFFLLPFVAMMIWMLIPYVTGSIRSWEFSSNPGGLIVWPAKLMLLVGFVLLGFQSVSEIIKSVAVLTGRIEDPHAPAKGPVADEAAQ